MQKKNKEDLLLESVAKANLNAYMSEDIVGRLYDSAPKTLLKAKIDSQELKVLSYSKSSLKTNITLLIDEETATGIILEDKKVLSLFDRKISLDKVIKYKVVKKKDNYILKIKLRNEDLK